MQLGPNTIRRICNSLAFLPTSAVVGIAEEASFLSCYISLSTSGSVLPNEALLKILVPTDILQKLAAPICLYLPH